MFVLQHTSQAECLFQKDDNEWLLIATKENESPWISQIGDPTIQLNPSLITALDEIIQGQTYGCGGILKKITLEEASMILFGAE